MKRNAKRNSKTPFVLPSKQNQFYKTAPVKEMVLENETVYMNEKYFRPKTKWYETPIHFILSQGGLGDYINWIPSFEWLAEENPHVIAKIYLQEPFRSVAKYLLKKYEPRMSVHAPEELKDLVKEGHGICNGNEYSLYINATGAHLMDLGFMLHCTASEAFEGYNRLPKIDYKDDYALELLGATEENDPPPYAVFTPGATVEARAMPAKALNELVQYTKDKGITPVFLGKKDFAEGKRTENYYAKFKDDYDFSLGLDLREKTTLLQATQIMGGARFVLGVDNGLLHFAGCTEVPIIFGHTVATVKQRDIRRPKGTTINIAIDKKDLPCIGCQANMRYIIGHNFSKCVYDDYKCLELLFANNSATWKKAIDLVLQNVHS